MGSGRFEQDILDYPGLYLFDNGAIDENPQIGRLDYGSDV